MPTLHRVFRHDLRNAFQNLTLATTELGRASTPAEALERVAEVERATDRCLAAMDLIFTDAWFITSPEGIYDNLGI